MDGAEYRNAIERCHMNHNGVASLLDVSRRTSERWGTGTMPVPRSVELVLRLMLRYHLTPDKALNLLKAKALQ